MLPTAHLEYHLPETLIATRPAEPRDAARLLVCSRTDPTRLEHRRVRDLPEYLHAEDVVVFNNTAVLPARLRARRAATGGKVSALYLGPAGAGEWRLLARSNGRLRPGDSIELLDARGEASDVALTLESRNAAEWTARVSSDEPTERILERLGATPLPPYIRRARRETGHDIDDQLDRQWYQTVFADPSSVAGGAGSVAAPTAGLHFTSDLLGEIEARGAARCDVTLHVGWGTFKPIETEHVEEHRIHEEWFSAPPATLRRVAETKQRMRGRIVAVGTTTARTLESLPKPLDEKTIERGDAAATDLLISPGHQWKHVDALLTNFHLPRSSLLAMVASLFPEGPKRLLEIYREAVRRRYRFYSYGDAMLILP